MGYIVQICLGISLVGSAMGLNTFIAAPGITKSISLFNNRLACSLAERGHQVTLLTIMFATELGDISANCNITEIHYEITEDTTVLDNDAAIIQEWAFSTENLKMVSRISESDETLNELACDRLINDEQLFQRLKRSGFHLALVTPWLCPTALAMRLGLPVLWLSESSYILEYMVDLMETPLPVSYIPQPFISSSDRMDFLERLKNTMFVGYYHYWPSLFPQDPQEQRIVEYASGGQQVNSFRQLVNNIPLVMLNSEIILEMPRPLSTPFHFLGAVEPQRKKPSKVKSLSKEWQCWMNEPKKGIILFSFGTAVNTTKMPLHMKDAFLKAFQMLDDYNIVWKVTEEFALPNGTDHIRLSKWVPQRELLGSPQLKLFITHGGYNSLLESCHASVPILTIPLKLDQPGNSHKAERLGIGLTLHKTNITHQSVSWAMSELLKSNSYASRSHSISNMLTHTPAPIADTMVHLIERSYRHYHTLPRFTRIRHLNFVTYYCLDVIGAAVSAIIIIALSTIYLPSLLWLAVGLGEDLSTFLLPVSWKVQNDFYADSVNFEPVAMLSLVRQASCIAS